MSSLSMERIIAMTIEVPQTPPSAPSFSGVCIFGKSTKLASYERVKSFTPDTLGSRFSASDPEYKAASLAFAQRPRLARVFIARRFLAAQAGTLLGSSHATLDALKAIVSGQFDIVVDGTTIHVTGLDLSGCGTLAAVATAIQTKLAAGLASTTCAYTADGQFLVTSPTTGTTSTADYAEHTASDTTTADALGLSREAGALRTAGFAAEVTVADSMTAAKRANSGWFSWVLSRDANLTDQQDAADWGAANERPGALTTSSAAAYAAPANDDTDIAGYNKRKANGFAFTTYSTDHPDAGIGALARIAVVNYNLRKSVITLWGKVIGGVAAEDISEDQADGLLAKNCNVVASFGGNTGIYNPGKMGDGTWIDQVFGLAWLKAESLLQLYAAMTAAGRTFQTDDDVGKLVSAWEAALDKGVTNGLIAPGKWPETAEGLGNIQPGDRLELGYYVYADSVDSQSEADRMTRIAPPISALVKGSGAIQGLNIKLTFSP